MTVETLIQDGVVVQVAAERFDVNPALSWATGPDATAVGDRYDGSSFSKPVAAPSPSARIVSAAEFMALFTPAQTAALWSADPLLMTGAIRVMVQGTDPHTRWHVRFDVHYSDGSQDEVTVLQPIGAAAVAGLVAADVTATALAIGGELITINGEAIHA